MKGKTQLARFVMIIALVMLVFTLAACGGGKADPLAGTKWTLDTLSGQPLTSEVVITAEFNDGRISGSAGCNSYGSAYTVDGSKLTLESVAMTEMACEDQAIMQAEGNYTSVLGSVVGFQVEGERLNLSNEAGETVLSFSSQ